MLATVAPAAAAIDEKDAEPSVFAIRVVNGSEERAGTAVLLGRERRGGDDELYFLTSSRPLEPIDRGRGRPSAGIRLFVDAGKIHQVDPEHVYVPANSLFPVAVFRVTLPARPAVVRPIVYEAPPAGAVFLIAGFDRAGSRLSVVEHVRFESSRLAMGDRDASVLQGCAGAPAIGERGVFGIVTECAPGRAPMITLLSLARTFIEAHIPLQALSRDQPTQFQIEEREISGPNLEVTYGTPVSGEVDIPVVLKDNERLIDATPRIVMPRELAVGEATVVRRDDRSVRVRFTVGSDPLPPTERLFHYGQALITLRVRVAIVPRF
jgi:hypothetical protein